ncbi:hypothetical protein B0J11DRAFT_619197 [Dendryphion nanum]|uniref:DUF3176 domain containing protein n=1 Tax=Dendryphion nanum TaxID=256645 RepID=A0A9P9IBK4_9PLEO|nr:hypothetical protein B0J11DRAFT_619197 [Dendryphion nanum]
MQSHTPSHFVPIDPINHNEFGYVPPPSYRTSVNPNNISNFHASSKNNHSTNDLINLHAPVKYISKAEFFRNDKAQRSYRVNPPRRKTYFSRAGRKDTVEKPFGLGIHDTPLAHIDSGIDQSFVKRPPSPNNAAQWLEKKLWQYSSSKSVITRWILEIISWCLSALCMTAVIVVLIFVQNKRAPEWPLSQTLNMLSRVASAALILPVSEALGQLKWNWFQTKSKTMWDFEIFDNASRGPWGSALLLVRTKGRTLASLGAAVTLLALAMDPFFQQLFDIRERWSIVGNGSIPIVTNFDPLYPEIFTGNTGIPDMLIDSYLDVTASKFFFDSGKKPVYFGNVTRPEISLSCPSRNCTWEPYDTMAVCSSCTDASPMLSFGCHTTAVDWTMNLTGGYGNWRPKEQPFPRGRACGYFLNSTSQRPVLMSGYLLDSQNTSLARPGEALLVRTMPHISTPLREIMYDGSGSFDHIRNPITRFIVAGTADGTMGSVYRNETPACHDCVIHWCVKRMRSSYYEGVYQQEEIQSFANKTRGPFPWKVEELVNSTPKQIALDYLEDVLIDVPNSPSNGTFKLSNFTHLKINAIFDSFLPSFFTQSNESTTPLLRYAVYVTGRPKTRKLPTNPWAAPGNITRHVHNLSLALSDAVRSHQSGQAFSGTSWDIERFVSVEWPWLTLPIIILCLSFIFLAATVRKTANAKDGVGVWKSSALATLVYGGMSEDLKKQMRHSQSVGTPRTKARRMKARLLPNKGWRISGKFSPTLPQHDKNQPPPPPGWI